MADDKNLLHQAIIIKNCGNNLFVKKEYENAIKMYEQSIELCPKSENKELAVIHQNIAACWEKLKKFLKVIEECTRAIQLNSRYVKAFSRRANAYELTGCFNEALNDLATVCVLETPETEAMAKFHRISRRINCFKDDQWMNSCEALNEVLSDLDAVCALNATESEESFTKYGNLLRRISVIETEKWISSRGEVLLSDEVIRLHFSNFINNGFIEGKVDSRVLNNTLSCLENELGVVDRCQKINAIKGTIQYLKTNYSAADELFVKIVQSDCNKCLKIYALIMLAISSLRPFLKPKNNEIRMMLPKTYEKFDAAIEIDPQNADIYFHRANAYYIVGKYEIAIKDLKTFIELSGKQEKAKGKILYLTFQRLFNSESSSYRVVECLLEFRNELTLNPNSSELLMYYMTAVLQLSRCTGNSRYFSDVFQYASALRGCGHDFQLFIAFSYMMSKDYKKGIDLLKVILKEEKHCQTANEYLSWLYVCTGKLDVSVIIHIDTALKYCASRRQVFTLIRLKKIILSLINTEHTLQSPFCCDLILMKFASHMTYEFYNNWFSRHFFNGISLLK
ncbi:hypothetical protein B4U80_06044 [Leptotrombidium deliense]|uniref:Mitochondrial import receptor subunit TOM70-like protein n=1 Tax=Leptotrombidium deliense TaxID=299467 RepID=A0A443S456_9ACAR|nr:hypothetical protein B4U80_06044 [Leptotrombidium deliense]